ncbi:unnamed protein product [Angiostrongylus costaricensis]|uniref:Anaphase-promoting complex subunit 5 n=1 Tax=Angiostrongylus costaricensis TaxID=334426 RepID=A0A0R3PX99_ANGCS|nr:unnamed protein product [Angiostrongylus costaricensis]
MCGATAIGFPGDYGYDTLEVLCAEWSQHSTQRIFEYNKRFIQWVRAADSHGDGLRCFDPWDISVQISEPPVVPFEIESSVRARKWIANQMHLLQHLLEMLCHIRAMNLGRALQSLRLYFDYSMFRLNDSVVAANVHGARLGVLDQRSLRLSASLLLCECVQQAQNHDVACLRMAMVELAALEAMSPSDTHLNILVDDKSSGTLISSESLLRMINRASGTDTLAEGEVHRDAVVDTNESQQLFDQMHALANLMTAITAARQCKFPDAVEEGVERALRCNSGLDTGSRCRLINDAAVATTSSIRLKHGFAKAARSIATALVDTNYGEGTAPRHETDAHAIAGVNMVYASVMIGEWDRAFHILRKLKSIFTPDINWQCAQYVQLCDSIISFDCAILCGQFDKCVPILEDIEVMDHAEAALRKALFLAVQGEITGARNFLETLYTKYETPSTVVVHMRLRLQLAMLLSAECRWSAATEMLNGVREEAISVEHRNIAGMALRRIGVVQMLSGDYESAVTNLTECKKDINRYCSVLERAILSIALAKAYSHCRDGCETVRFLNKARVHCRQAGATLFEKFVLHELALYYNEHDAIEERDEIAAEFAELDERHAGLFDWNLV